MIKIRLLTIFLLLTITVINAKADNCAEYIRKYDTVYFSSIVTKKNISNIPAMTQYKSWLDKYGSYICISSVLVNHTLLQGGDFKDPDTLVIITVTFKKLQ
jgi:hypothetical protein